MAPWSHTRLRRTSGRAAPTWLAVFTLVMAGLAVAGTPARADAPSRCRGHEATIVGTPGNDRLTGTRGDDVIVGLEDRDTIDGGKGDDLICGGSSVEEYDIDGYLREQYLSGGPGADHVVGGDGADAVYGGEGEDVVRGAGAVDYVYGDGSIGAEGDDRVYGGRGDDSIEGGKGRDRLWGGPDADTVVGQSGTDVVRGEAGVDELHGGMGDDVVDGGADRDAVALNVIWTNGSIVGNTTDVHADLRLGVARSKALGRDRLLDIEDVWTGSGEDTIIGDGRANLLYPGEWFQRRGVDKVRGGGGPDTVSFSPDISRGCCDDLRVDLAKGRATFGKGRITLAGIDNVIGQGDRDVLLGDSGPNVLVGEFDHDDSDYRLQGATIRGRGGDDQIVGSSLRDHLYGGGGNDTLTGGSSADLLDGGTGTNTIDGGSDADTCARPGPAEGAVGCEVTG